MKLRLSGYLLIAGLTTFGVSVAFAQTLPSQPARAPFANPPYKNLKVFPQTITRDQLISNMKLFTQSLGVRCSFCHVGEEGKPLSTFDFASEAKEKKLRAREMLEMAHRINREEFDGMMKVTCFTCHRGTTSPAALPPADADVAPSPPSDSNKPQRG